jgi:acyl-CoA thioester hydrolase
MAEPSQERRGDFPYRLSIPSRWEDGDMLRHINNVVFYQYFQQVFVTFLREEGGLDWFADKAIPYAVESSLKLLRPLAYPDVIDVGMRVASLGNSSVTYEFALFRQGEAAGDEPPAAVGRFVHVFVDRASQRPTPIPDRIRAAYQKILTRPR